MKLLKRTLDIILFRRQKTTSRKGADDDEMTVASNTSVRTVDMMEDERLYSYIKAARKRTHILLSLNNVLPPGRPMPRQPELRERAVEVCGTSLGILYHNVENSEFRDPLRDTLDTWQTGGTAEDIKSNFWKVTSEVCKIERYTPPVIHSQVAAFMITLRRQATAQDREDVRKHIIRRRAAKLILKYSPTTQDELNQLLAKYTAWCVQGRPQLA